jgi:hypothetical protein
MYLATFFFLTLSICIFAGLICFSMARLFQKAKAEHVPADEKATWEELKTAIRELHSRYESTESPRQKALRSWAGTLVICAGLCMIGILLETQYNKLISPRSIISGLFEKPCVTQRMSHPAPAHHAKPAAAKPMPGPINEL